MKITIARECGCYGDEVGQVLADRLNVPLYNKKTLTELAKKKGILEHYPDYFGENPAGTLLAVIAEDGGEDSVVHRTPRKVLDELIGGDIVYSDRQSWKLCVPEGKRCGTGVFKW